MELGIFARTFRRASLDQTLAAVRSHGLGFIQFNFCCVGQPTLPETIESCLVQQVYSQLDQHSLSIASISGTCNLIHPQESRRCSNLEKLEILIRAAPRLSCTVVTLCSGSRDVEDMWRWHPENQSPAARRDLVKSLERLLPVAEQNGVILGIEPEPANVINTAPAARSLLDEMRSPNLGIVFGAANLMCNNAAEQGRVLSEAIELLGPDIAVAHAKDLAPDDCQKTVATGTGRLDYPLYLSLLQQSDFTGPLILHSLEEGEVAAAVVFLQQLLGRLGTNPEAARR